MAIDLKKTGFSYSRNHAGLISSFSRQIGRTNFVHTGQYCREEKWHVLYAEAINSEIFKELAWNLYPIDLYDWS